MRLNLPIEILGRTVLLAGAGGGWDVFGALPLAYELERRNCRVVLANYSSSVGGFDVRPAQPGDHPEAKLAAKLGRPVYVFGKEGARTLTTLAWQVSNVKSILASKRKSKAAPAAAAAAPEATAGPVAPKDAVSIGLLQKAKKLAAQLGGIKEAKAAMDALVQILD